MEATEREMRRRLWQAWHTAVLGRVKQIPGLDTLLDPPKPISHEEAKRLRETWDESVEELESALKRKSAHG